MSTLSAVSLQPAQSVLGDINVLNVTPEGGQHGRISVYIAAGSSVSAGGALGAQTALQTDERSDDGSVVPHEHRGLELIAGGAAAPGFAGCASDGIRVRQDLSYDDLSESEQNAVIRSVELQNEDRSVQYGSRSGGVEEKSPIETAGGFRFTTLEAITVAGESWSMPAYSGGASGSSAASSSDSPVAAEEAFGYGVFFQCDVDFASLWLRQSWGARFELPAFTVATAPIPSGVPARSAAFVGIYRWIGSPRYLFSTTQGMDGAELQESSAGLYGSRAGVTTFTSGGVAVASRPDVSVTYSRVSYSEQRDAKLFLAGILMSLFASTAIKVVPVARGRRNSSGGAPRP
ncbi:hypothetical protein [Cellulomonas sp. URHE0023]|uniref:hypothetical protein n=1 Tax=Cellulomonas sp. URHE0023 TaxID=1380354 RepID=UPI0012DC1943|nr:hypothetical protein [Cellulomonas sp. URHE0023]